MTALDQYALLEAEAVYYDGQTAIAHDVILRFGETTLTLLTYQDEPIQHWALASLRQIAATRRADGQEELRLAPGHDEDERLVLADPSMIGALRQVCPDLQAGPPAQGRSILRRVAAAALGLAGIAGLLFVAAPMAAETLAARISAERAGEFGEVVERSAALAFSGKPLAEAACTAPEGMQALQALMRRLRTGAPDAPPLQVTVIEAPAANAITAPGGRILVLSGLIDAAETPEQLAGVLAHEIAHAISRDPLRETLRSAGTFGVAGLLVGDFAGGIVTAGLVQAVIDGAYAREAEADADIRALEIMARAGLPAAALGEMFETFRAMGLETPAGLSHLSTHPDLTGRAARARAADRIGDGPFRPALEDGQWVALQQICER